VHSAVGAFLGVGMSSGGYRDATPAYYEPVCEAALADAGYPRASEVYCPGAEPLCARELVYRGFTPPELVYCRGVEPGCAVAYLRAGAPPSALLGCR
jgi:hypothetical protein